MFTAMRPQILFPLFAEVSSLKGVGPRILPLVQKVAGPLVGMHCIRTLSNAWTTTSRMISTSVNA